MKVIDHDKWGIDSSHSNEREYQGIQVLLTSIAQSIPTMDFTPIVDVPSAVGIELSFNGRKIAEVYCAENRDGLVPEMYQVHCIKDWLRSEILNVKQLQSLVIECKNVVHK